MTRRLLLSYAVGGAFAVIGAYAFFSTGDLMQWISAGKWFIGGVVVHDFILTPVVLLVGVLLTRLVPGPYRAFAQAALYISGALTLSAAVLVLGWGRDPRVPSQQPLPYGRNLLVAIGLIWAGTAALSLVRYLRARPGRPSRRTSRSPGRSRPARRSPNTSRRSTSAFCSIPPVIRSASSPARCDRREGQCSFILGSPPTRPVPEILHRPPRMAPSS